MSNLLDRFRSAQRAFVGRGGGASSGPPGGFSLGTGWIGGPLSTDAWGAKRAPSPSELIENFKSITYSCGVINADAVSAVPLRLYMDSSRGKKPKDISGPREVSLARHRHIREFAYSPNKSVKVSELHEITSHPFLDTLNNPDPNEDFDLAQILKLIVLYCDNIGRAYFYPEGDPSRPYRWFWPLFSQYVTPIRKAGSPVVDRFQYFSESIDRRDIVWFGHNMSLRDPYGANFPPLYAAIEYARLEDKFVSIQEQLMAMGPRPNLIASPKDPNMVPGRDEKDRFEQDLRRSHARSAQGGVLVTQGAWDITPITYSPTDLAGLKIAEYDLERICGAYGVPIEFFTSDTNLANQQAAEIKHAKKAVRPRCVSIASRLTRIVRRWDERLFFAFDNPVTADAELEAKVFDMKIRNGSMTINQANAESGLPSVPWGDQPWLNGSMLQPEDIKKKNDAAIAMSQAGAVGMAEGGGNPAVKNQDVKKKGGEPKNKDEDKGDAERSWRPGTFDAEGEDGDPFGWGLETALIPPSLQPPERS